MIVPLLVLIPKITRETLPVLKPRKYKEKEELNPELVILTSDTPYTHILFQIYMTKFSDFSHKSDPGPSSRVIIIFDLVPDKDYGLGQKKDNEGRWKVESVFKH